MHKLHVGALPVCLLLMALMEASAAYGGDKVPSDETARRTAYLDELKRVLPHSKPWEEWLDSSKELPPDFAALPSRQSPPDPLEKDGQRISTPEEWQARRKELKQLFAKWVLGSVPPPPEKVDVEVQEEKKESGCLTRRVRLSFGPSNKASVRCEVMIPDGQAPSPVFLTQDNHRAWALIALQRGYIACVYAGADSCDDTDSFLGAYPEYDWSRLTRRAWAGSRCIDYLITLPEVDTAQIAITGHSRNGKQSLIASALDERIAAVISSSSGAGGCMPTRCYSEQHMGEGIENITRSFPEWFHPRWRFFAGREDRLPVDLNELVALSAPRACLLSIALNDSVESAWAMEKTCLSVKPVYDLFGAGDRLEILYRPASHETHSTTIERYLDWCDVQFGRGGRTSAQHLMYPHDWQAWSKKVKVSVEPGTLPVSGVENVLADRKAKTVKSQKDWEDRKPEIQQSVRKMLGEEPPKAKNSGGEYGANPDHITMLLGRSKVDSSVERHSVVFGEYISADVYLPAARDPKKRLQAILWLHPFNPSRGYAAAYRRGEQPYMTFARAGYAVFCYDQIGFGRRIEEIDGFYDRYPEWSWLGKMVRDAQSALDAMQGLDFIDPERIWVVGYSMGALVGLHLCALDDRPSGMVAACAPTPFRLDTCDDTGGGLRRWAQESMLAPAFGFFIGQESRMPYDIHELLGCTAPRPVCVISADFDREAPAKLVAKAVDAAKPAYNLLGAKSGLEQIVIEGYNRFGPEMQTIIIEWLDKRNR